MMMKIAHITTAITGGAGIATLRLHEGLLESDKDVSSKLLQSLFLDVKYDTLDVYRCPESFSLSYRIKKKFRLLKYLTTQGMLQEYISRYPKTYEIVTLPVSRFRLEEHPIVKDADIIHLHWTCDFLNYSRFFKKVKKPIVWTLHDMNPFQGLFHYNNDQVNNERMFKELDVKATKIKLRALKHVEDMYVVCLSNWMKEKSMDNTMLSRFPHYLIPNGVNSEFYPLQNKIAAKEALGLNNGKKTILFVANGVDVQRKGFDILLKSIEALDPTSFNLISVGEKNTKLSTKYLYKHFGMISDISQLNTLYTAADITALPSREDNLPNVMIESMMNGTPLICFNNGGMIDHVKTNETGIILNEISDTALSQGLSDFINNKYLFDQEGIRNYAINNFSLGSQVDQYITLYEQILRK